jgi:hypothetical protein
MTEPRRRRKLSPPIAPWVGGLILLGLIGVAALWLARRETGVDAPWSASPGVLEDSAGLSRGSGAVGPDSGARDPFVDAQALAWGAPPPGGEDAWLRQLVLRLSRHPEWARFLVSDALMERFVGAVVDLAGGFYPGEYLPELRPDAPMTSVQRGEDRFIDPDSYRRFNTLVAVIQSLDAEGAARLYPVLLPLMEETYASLGLPGSVQVPLGLAARNLLAIQFPREPLAISGEDGVYIYEDLRWEEARGATKALLRMGPAHGQRIQEKVREFVAAIDLQIPTS